MVALPKKAPKKASKQAPRIAVQDVLVLIDIKDAGAVTALQAIVSAFNALTLLAAQNIALYVAVSRKLREYKRGPSPLGEEELLFWKMFVTQVKRVDQQVRIAKLHPKVPKEMLYAVLNAIDFLAVCDDVFGRNSAFLKKVAAHDAEQA